MTLQPQPSEFSREAKASMAGDPSAQVRDRLIAAIRQRGPSTTDEIEALTGLKHQTASPCVLALRTEGVLVYRGTRLTRSKRWAAVWGLAEDGQAETQPQQPAAVSVDPVGSGSTQEGMFETVPEVVQPALRPSDYACGVVTNKTVNGIKRSTTCLTPLDHVYEVLFDSRFVRGHCPACKKTVEGSLIRAKAYPIGYGTVGKVVPKTTKLRRVRKRK